MIETLVSLGLVVAFCVIGWAIVASPIGLVWGGLGLVGVGFAYGIPAAVVYHWALHRALSRAGRLPPRWWLQPTALHDRVPAPERGRVLFWGALGGSGFGLIVLGIVLTSIGTYRLLAP